MTNTVYKGELKYGRRSTKPGGREVISASVPSLVSAEMWEVAQQTLAQNRIISENTERIYLLRSVIRWGGVRQDLRILLGPRVRLVPLQRALD